MAVAAASALSLPLARPVALEGTEQLAEPACAALANISFHRAPREHSAYRRVVLADYPSTGSSWLRALLSAVASQLGVPSPACSVYGSDDECELEPQGLACPRGSGGCTQPPAALVKTHFPAQELLQCAAAPAIRRHARASAPRGGPR